MARSLAALAQGFAGFDPALTWAGLVANQVGGPRHGEILSQAMEQVSGLPFRGALRRRPEIALPERHLGLVTAQEGGLGDEAMGALADWLEKGLELDRLLNDLPEMTIAPPPEPEPSPSSGARVRLGVARDEAFCFYYQENFRRLQQAGAELVFFSPLNDTSLPPDLDGLYLGGGYPELFAQRLADNRSLRREVASFGRQGGVIYAECGGMMFLGRGLTDTQGRRWPMAGLLELETKMLPRLRTLGYRQVKFRADTPLGAAGAVARGHEFHYSEICGCAAGAGSIQEVYQATGRSGPQPETKGYLARKVLASYVHLHFGSNPDLAAALVAACRQSG
jgi:cobyrinic acid a,c-diamide synthase